jgi:ubiquinone/menaquinone biosynthesis C-methylase UbiE
MAFIPLSMSQMKKARNATFNDSGDFLGWWFDTELLEGKALQVFQRYYSSYYKDFNGYLKKAWADRHLELDRELEGIENKSNTKIMDLGCGTGSIALYVAGKLRNKCEVVGVDINEERLFCARERQKVLEKNIGFKLSCEFMESNVLSLDENRKFDLIYLEETLHHLEPRLEVVRKISNLIRMGGTLIISEVNAQNIVMQLHLFRKRGFRTVQKRIGKNNQAILYGVERILTANRVAKLFTRHNLNVNSLRYFRLAPSKLGRFLDKCGIDFLNTEKIICKPPFLRNLFAVHYNIVLGK